MKIKNYKKPTKFEIFSNSFDSETVLLKNAFKQYKNSVKKYISGKPSPEVAKLRLTKSFDHMVSVLNNPVIVFRFGKLIEAGINVNYGTIKELMLGISSEELDLEFDLAGIFDIDKRNIKHVMQSYKDDTYKIKRATSIADIIDHMEDIHDELIVLTEKARAILPRVEKKKRKKDIKKAIHTAVFGAACGVANTYFFLGLSAATSYGVMLTSFGAALHHMIGEKPKD